MIKQFIADKIKTDETNRLYIKTKENPTGELIIGEEVDEFLYTVILEFAQEFVKGITPIKKSLPEDDGCSAEYYRNELRDVGNNVIGHNNCVNQIRSNAQRALKEME